MKEGPELSGTNSHSSSSRQLLSMDSEKSMSLEHALSIPMGMMLPSDEDCSASSSTMEETSAVSDESRSHGRSWHCGSRSNKVMTILRAFFHMPMSCNRWLPMPQPHSQRPGHVITGTLFGYRKGHVHFAVQEDPKSHPLLLLEMATPTNSLVKEMASGLVRIALECERKQNRGKLHLEQVWTMYCNGRKTGYAIKRACSEADLKVLRVVQAVSMGAGVLPMPLAMEQQGPDGELMYMRARFERVVGSKDSEAFYMMNPDGTGSPELSIFLLRI